ncbi:MAG: Fe-S cluster protein [Bacteroidetes bacterium]|nr:Fe-S cluster protein [Bacteroidota bacterium]
MLLTGYTLRMVSSDCNPFATTANAVAALSDDVSAVLPYLNAVLKGARYDPIGMSLIFQRDGHRVVLQSRQAAMTKLEDEAEGTALMDWLVETINRTWDERGEIEPDHRAARQPGLLEVYKGLPGGNCRACGEATCLAFATKLLREEVDLAACSPLFTEQHSDAREKLLELLGQ